MTFDVDTTERVVFTGADCEMDYEKPMTEHSGAACPECGWGDWWGDIEIVKRDGYHYPRCPDCGHVEDDPADAIERNSMVHLP